jgi:hypothetical protein
MDALPSGKYSITDSLAIRNVNPAETLLLRFGFKSQQNNRTSVSLGHLNKA